MTTGPVVHGTPMAALESIVALFQEAGVRIVRIAYRGIESDGRHAFAITTPANRGIVISMPGLDPATLRSDDILRTPRIYVDGNSWLWRYAVSQVRS